MPWKVIKRDCKQADGTSGSYVVLKEKGSGSTEQSSCHDTKEKAQGSIAARKMREGKQMKITKRQLRQIIREAIAGNVHGDPEKEKFLDIAMISIQRGDYRKATNAILDSFMMDDTFPEEEQVLMDMLVATPAGVSSREVEAIADKWHAGYRAGEYRPS